MKFSDALASDEKRFGGPSCSTCLARDLMSKEDRESFDAACNDPAISGIAIVRACQKVGATTITVGSLRRHRRGECLATRM